MVCRPGQKAEKAFDYIKKEVPGAKVHLLGLDMEDIDAVEKFPDVLKKEGVEKIDVLINNAGIMQVPHALTKYGWERHFAVNHLSHFALTNNLLPLLKNAEGDVRIVNLASEAHRHTTAKELPFDDIHLSVKKKCRPESLHRILAYGNSKRANILHANELHDRLQSDTSTSHITAYSLHPGVITDTELWTTTSSVMKGFLNIGRVFLKTIPQGAATTLFCAVDPQAKVLREKGSYFADCDLCKPVPECNKKDRCVALWDLSQKLIDERKEILMQSRNIL